MASGVTIERIDDERGYKILIKKKKGKLSISEIQNLILYESGSNFHGHYAMVLNCSDDAAGGDGLSNEVSEGDSIVLYQLFEGDTCPVCNNLLPPFECCPNCGEPWRKESF